MLELAEQRAVAAALAFVGLAVPVAEDAMFRLAVEVAVAAHAGQEDKAGEPYIFHPLRVANYLTTWDEKTVGVLHDVIEDTGTTEDDLLLMFPYRIVDAVLALTHTPGTPSATYLAAIVASGPLAARVKRADVRDNTDPARRALLDKATAARLAIKYEKTATALDTTVSGIHAEFPGTSPSARA